MDQIISSTTTSALTHESAFQGVGDAADQSLAQIGIIWEHILRTPLIVPLLNFFVWVCLIMSVMLFIEIGYMGITILLIKLFRRKPEKRYKWEPIIKDIDDVELGNSNYPMVLVQIPMYNEKEVYQFAIGAACGLSWPTDRIIIQVLDDSTDPAIKKNTWLLMAAYSHSRIGYPYPHKKERKNNIHIKNDENYYKFYDGSFQVLVESEVRKWESKGINIKYEIRDNRNGYKAGALKQGLKHSYVSQCDYVAIFDADFQPEPDFLIRTIPFFVHNTEIGLVQARWEFVNANECWMTRFQEMSLNYHFTVEQEVGSSTYAFFGFNGTAGVWRIAALNEAGGWNDRTTVEDMDLAVRASLKGWKFVFIGDLKVKSELPSKFKALRYQQHRWSCGPANLFRKMAMEIITNKKVTMWKKVHVIYSFFFVRKIIAHIVSFVFYCVLIPATVFFPEVHIPNWGLFYIPTIITILNSLITPRSLHLLVFWISFENVMSMHRTKGVFIGLLEYGRANEWVVTEKLGDTLIKSKAVTEAPTKPQLRIAERFHLLELSMGAYLFVCGCYDVAFGKNYYFLYLYTQSIAFFVAGVGYIGTLVPNS